jgi:hypothetical protein
MVAPRKRDVKVFLLKNLMAKTMPAKDLKKFCPSCGLPAVYNGIFWSAVSGIPQTVIACSLCRRSGISVKKTQAQKKPLHSQVSAPIGFLPHKK